MSVEYIKDLVGLGYQHVSLDDLVRLRDHGVNPQWLRKVHRGSAARLSIDDLVSLRDHGLDSPERGPQLHGWNWREKLEALFGRWIN